MTREVVVDAPPERVWPLLASIPAIRPAEGRWNLTRDVLGVPRPTEALLRSQQGRAVREARWDEDVRFEERILEVEPQRSIAWQFAFSDDSVRRHTDEHIAPDGAHMRIAFGGYRLSSLPAGRTRVTLETRYRLQTPLNAYAGWWGEFLLGDIQDNVLAIVKGRAEAPAPRS